MAELFVWGVKEKTPNEVLENEFGECGEVLDAYNTGRGYAYVTMVSID